MEKFKVNLKIRYDKKKPNGTPRKRLDITLAKSYGWLSRFSLDKGFDLTYKNFLNSNLQDKK